LKFWGVLLLSCVLFYIGFRPISIVFTDMKLYTEIFKNFQLYGAQMLENPRDYFFDVFTLVCSKIMSVHMYFFTCACLYVIPLYVVSVKWFKKRWVYMFLVLVVSFSFWNFGTNGLRNGIATSLFLLAISRDKLLWKIIWLIVAINIHLTMFLPFVGFSIATLYNKPKQFLIFWFACIPISIIAGGAFQVLFSRLMGDERSSYFIEEAISSFSSSGFRWDFLIYSSTAVFSGWYYIFKRNFKDKFYSVLYSTYLFANGFWILVIKANFSNRFAYLSWFMLAVVIFYPWLKEYLVQKQHIKLGYLILTYALFTFFMNVII